MKQNPLIFKYVFEGKRFFNPKNFRRLRRRISVNVIRYNYNYTIQDRITGFGRRPAVQPSARRQRARVLPGRLFLWEARLYKSSDGRLF